jgi:hypothetical protein
MKLCGIIALVFSLFLGEQAYSQTQSSFTPEWGYGVNGGLTSSRVGFTSYISVPQALLNQFSGGITVRYISESHFGIQGELNYSLRGWKERTDTVHLNTYTRSIAYLELPVMTHIYFNFSKQVRFVFNIGPQVGYCIKEKDLERNIVEEIDDPTQNYYNIHVQHPFDYGLKGTLGLEFRTKAGSFILDGRYYFGLSDIFSNTRHDPFQGSHNQVIGLNLTYLLRK